MKTAEEIAWGFDRTVEVQKPYPSPEELRRAKWARERMADGDTHFIRIEAQDEKR